MLHTSICFKNNSILALKNNLCAIYLPLGEKLYEEKTKLFFARENSLNVTIVCFKI